MSGLGLSTSKQRPPPNFLFLQTRFNRRRGDRGIAVGEVTETKEEATQPSVRVKVKAMDGVEPRC